MELGSFRQGVTSCRGFVLSSGPGTPRMATACPARVRRTRGTRNLARERILLPSFARMPWLRFATAHEIGFVSSRRYRLPWLRFVDAFRFVRGIIKALQFAHHSFPRSPAMHYLQMELRSLSPVYGALRAAVIGPPFTAGSGLRRPTSARSRRGRRPGHRFWREQPAVNGGPTTRSARKPRKRGLRTSKTHMFPPPEQRSQWTCG